MYVGRSFDENYSLDKAEDVVEKHKEKVGKLFGKCTTRDKSFIEGLAKELFPLA